MNKECCSKQRVEIALKSLGKEQLGIIIKEDRKVEVVCPYCNKKYNFSEKELNEILLELN